MSKKQFEVEMVAVVTTNDGEYRGVPHKSGESIEVTPSDKKVMLLHGFIKDGE